MNQRDGNGNLMSPLAQGRGLKLPTFLYPLLSTAQSPLAQGRGLKHASTES